jgi:hypothetical protein
MDERMQFVARRLAGEPMAALWRKFGISRKTGYKIFDRYQECGIPGLTDRSRSKTVTHVTGTLCNPRLRAGPEKYGAPGARRGGEPLALWPF